LRTRLSSDLPSPQCIRFGQDLELDPSAFQLRRSGRPGRFAYDLSIVDSAGRMYRGAGSRNEDWYSWNAPVLSPGAGTVVAAESGEQDWEVGRTSLPDSIVLARPVALYGNYW